MEVVDTEQYVPLEALSESAPPQENCGGSSAFVVLCWLHATSSEWLRRGAAGVWHLHSLQLIVVVVRREYVENGFTA